MGTTSSTTTGDRVRLERKRLGLTQEQLAVKAGLTLVTLRRIELDKNPKRSIGTLVKVAKALDVTAGYLLDGAPSSNEEAS